MHLLMSLVAMCQASFKEMECNTRDYRTQHFFMSKSGSKGKAKQNRLHTSKRVRANHKRGSK